MVKAMNPLTTYQRHHSIFHLRTCTTISLKFHDYFLLQVHLKILNCFFYGKKNFPMLRTPRAGHLRLPRRKKTQPFRGDQRALIKSHLPDHLRAARVSPLISLLRFFAAHRKAKLSQIPERPFALASILRLYFENTRPDVGHATSAVATRP